MQIIKQVEVILKNSFDIQKLEILDESSKHTNHPEALRTKGGHLTILVVSNDFEGKSLLERHRCIYDLLKKEMGSSIHALAIKALTVKEFAQRTDD